MQTIDVFYQGEGIREIAHLVINESDTFEAIKIVLIQKHGLHPETLLYLEDADEPLDGRRHARDHRGRAGIKIHLHRCRNVKALVTFNGETVHHQFGPGATVTRVKTWAAQHKFGMSAAERAEHVLQISGTQDRPDPGAHLGTLASCPDCRIAFDLVPNERVNGAPDAGALA